MAVRRSDGRRTVFGKPSEPLTNVASAVAASCAIPGYFTPVDIDGSSYVDGAVHSPTNADLLAGQAVHTVIVSYPMSVGSNSCRPRLDLPIRHWFRWYLRQEQWTLRQKGSEVITLEPDGAELAAMGLHTMSARRYDEVETGAYELATKRLPRLSSLA